MAKTKTKPREEEVDEDEDLELEDLEADVDEDEEAPRKKSARQEVTFGVKHLADHLTEETGKKVTPRDLRTLIRKMARDGSGRVNREITPDNRSRYDWPEGLSDPEVKRIVKAVTKGELEKGKQEALAKLKERKAAKGKTSKKKKGQSKPPVDEDEELEEVDDED